MNANELWSGNDYAHTDNISRGVMYYERANRVKVMRVYKEKDYGSERSRTMVEVMMLKDDGEPKKNAYDGKEIIKSVRARDIFMRWDEYAEERRHRHEKREQIAQQQQEERIKEEELKAALLDALEARFGDGFDRLWISTVNDYTVCIRRPELQNWLGVS